MRLKAVVAGRADHPLAGALREVGTVGAMFNEPEQQLARWRVFLLPERLAVDWHDIERIVSERKGRNDRNDRDDRDDRQKRAS